MTRFELSFEDLTGRLFLTVPEVARILRADPRTIRRAINGGDITAVRVNGVVRIPTQRFIEEMGLTAEPRLPAEDAPLKSPADVVQLVDHLPTDPSAA